MKSLELSAVRSHLSPTENGVISDGELELASHWEAKLVSPYREPSMLDVPDMSRGEVPAGSESRPLSVREFSNFVKGRFPSLAKIDDDVLVANVLAKYPQYRSSMNGQALEAASTRFDQIIDVQEKATKNAKQLATVPALREERLKVLRNSAALTCAPIALAYVLGWCVGWVRRGFQQSAD